MLRSDIQHQVKILREFYCSDVYSTKALFMNIPGLNVNIVRKYIRRRLYYQLKRVKRIGLIIIYYPIPPASYFIIKIIIIIATKIK